MNGAHTVNIHLHFHIRPAALGQGAVRNHLDAGPFRVIHLIGDVGSTLAAERTDDGLKLCRRGLVALGIGSYEEVAAAAVALHPHDNHFHGGAVHVRGLKVDLVGIRASHPVRPGGEDLIVRRLPFLHHGLHDGLPLGFHIGKVINRTVNDPVIVRHNAPALFLVDKAHAAGGCRVPLRNLDRGVERTKIPLFHSGSRFRALGGRRWDIGCLGGLHVDERLVDHRGTAAAPSRGRCVLAAGEGHGQNDAQGDHRQYSACRYKGDRGVCLQIRKQPPEDGILFPVTPFALPNRTFAGGSPGDSGPGTLAAAGHLVL